MSCNETFLCTVKTTSTATANNNANRFQQHQSQHYNVFLFPHSFIS